MGFKSREWARHTVGPSSHLETRFSRIPEMQEENEP
jgi:hypothetical protein